MKLAIVDGKTLTTVLRQISAAPRGLSGSAFWYFSEDLLAIKWTSYEQPIDIQDGVPMEGSVRVSGRVMNQLGALADLKGEVEIQWHEDRNRLRIGIHSVPGTHVNTEPKFSLPLDARERDLLKQMLRWGSEQTVEAGYQEEVGEVEVRWKKSLKTAASALEWTGLSRRVLDAVVAELIVKGDPIPKS